MPIRIKKSWIDQGTSAKVCKRVCANTDCREGHWKQTKKGEKFKGNQRNHFITMHLTISVISVALSNMFDLTLQTNLSSKTTLQHLSKKNVFV